MELEKLGLSKNRITALKSKGFETVEDIQEFFPRAYEDYSELKYLSPEFHKQKIAITGLLSEVKVNKTPSGKIQLMAKVIDDGTGKKLHISWFGAYYMKKIIEKWVGKTVIVCGTLEYKEEYHSFHMNNPYNISTNIDKNLTIRSIYRKMSGISDEYMRTTISKALFFIRIDPIPENILKKRGLIDINRAYRNLHSPINMEILEQAKKRFVYGKLFDFTLGVEKKENASAITTPFTLTTDHIKKAGEFTKNLPYKLTTSQIDTCQAIFNEARSGRRVNALIQGDVGSGKSIVAFIIMFAMSQAGYQSILMAPTVVLAKQHYETLKELFEPYGVKVAFLGGSQKKAEKEKILQGIKNGAYQMIAGTHSLLSESIEYKKLGLTVIDEEHRFGVNQRETLMEKAKDGVHCINMSATPIPRTMASSIYGNSISVCDLELPGVRKPVQTAIFNNDQKIYEFIEKKIDEGRQAYVICPWIDSEDEDSEIMNVQDAYKAYSEYFAKRDDIKIGVLNGRMKDEEIFDIIHQFEIGEINILITTTVIEVGVNVPNATVMVINNAERFGLSQLHQLRGRVCRGEENGYCILKSEYKENPRLQIIATTINGYKIATEDMKLRGTGNILGTEQSGKNEYIDMILKYPDIYEMVKADVKEYIKGEYL